MRIILILMGFLLFMHNLLACIRVPRLPHALKNSINVQYINVKKKGFDEKKINTTAFCIIYCAQ